MTQQQPHCDHECVCPDYKASHSDFDEDPDSCTLSCYHRSLPHTSSTETPETPALDVMPSRHDKERYIQGYCDGKAFSEKEEAVIRNATLKEMEVACGFVPFEEHSKEYDCGFHHAMSLVRIWINRSRQITPSTHGDKQ